MKLKLFYNKSVNENAAHYYELAKESKEKSAGVEKAMEETEKEIKEAKKPEKKDVRIKRAKEWFEKFHFFLTSSGKLAIGGRSAQQNDLLVSKHMEEKDLFFHADIQGGSVVILKDGIDADEQEMQECAQFAGCFSNAWKNGNASVDVYCAKKEQLSKNVSGGFIQSGAFAITGERKWFKNTKLSLRIGIGGKESAEKEAGGKSVILVPDISKTCLKDELVLFPTNSGKDKGALAKSLAKRFSVHPDEFLELLPNGKTKTSQK